MLAWGRSTAPVYAQLRLNGHPRGGLLKQQCFHASRRARLFSSNRHTRGRMAAFRVTDRLRYSELMRAEHFRLRISTMMLWRRTCIRSQPSLVVSLRSACPRARGRWPDERLAMSAGVCSRRGRTLSKNRRMVKAVLTLCRKTYAVHEASVKMTCAGRAGPHERHVSVCIRGQTVTKKRPLAASDCLSDQVRK